jgi:hypothetical protein
MSNNSSDYGYTRKDAGRDVRTTFAYPIFQQFVADNQTMSDLFACAPYGRWNVVVDGKPTSPPRSHHRQLLSGARSRR